ncbi:MAG: TonB-dependent receptor, partial [Lacunisphaera sp.]|nr:TonB-dependent receptor [Lacunisphaera sp.]
MINPWLGANDGFAAGASPILANLSLEQLSEITITTASKRAESLAQTAAAVTVLPGEDIIRSGSTSIPEALRWVPGLDVAQINAAEWAVSARGFNARFANKLLVMVDGRSLYTPLLAGVNWDDYNPVLEDLERIEVVRGSGGALWGANAVNGVINILSKSAEDTQGTLVTVSGGTEKLLSAATRVGVALNDHAWLRVYAKYDLTGNSRWSDGAPGHDRWDNGQAGFRFDAKPDGETHVTVQGDAYQGERDRITPIVTPGGYINLDLPVRVSGANVLGRWTRAFSADAKLTLQSYWSHTWRDAVQSRETRDTFDFDLQHDWQPGGRHRLSWGAGYRWSADQTEAGIPGGFVPANYDFRLFNAFAQDEITLVDDRLKLTLGSKLEHNSFTGFELQPSVRLLWTPTPRASYWTSVSRATRTPNRADTGAKIDVFYLPPGPNASNPTPLPLLTRAIGNPALSSEAIVAYEAGWRMQVNPAFTVDLAGFVSQHRDFILGIPNNAGTFLELTPAPAHLVLPIELVNGADALSCGGELALTWQPRPNFRLMGSYSHLQVDAELRVTGSRYLVTLTDSAPENQFSLRASLDVRPDLQLDVNLRRVGAVSAYAVDDYTEGDLRLLWKIGPGFELAVTGQNLFHDRHTEFGPQTVEPRYAIERG